MISDKTLQEELIQLSDELEKQTIQLRREIHQCPELSFHEYKTSRVVMRELERMRKVRRSQVLSPPSTAESLESF